VDKIYVAGHRGLVGSALVRLIETQANLSWVGRSHAELDLCDRGEVFRYIKNETPDIVVVAAARVGGIGANSANPVQFLSDNLQIATNILDACHAANIERVLFLGSSCIYPRLSPQPIKEEYLLTGELEPTNEAYALAKISGLKLVQAYRRQYGRRWIAAMPTNLYGPGDNFDLETSHVLPAMIRKFHQAKIDERDSVVLWGTGTPRREFLHVDDLASACLHLLKSYDSDIVINVGCGEDISIHELAEEIRDVVGFKGKIHWDRSKPDGTPRKLLDTSRLSQLSWKPTIDLRTGLASTYESFLSNL
jgi:GDP-L-fucose synthase